jgi:hypothetical protein
MGSVLLASGSAWALDTSDDGHATASNAGGHPTPAVNVRAGIGFGFTVQSDQEALVQTEGYRGTRFHVTAEITKTLGERFGIGLFGLYGWRNAASQASASQGSLSDAPEYSERLGVIAGTLPIAFCICNHRVVMFRLAPFLGAGFGRVELYGHAPWRTGPAFGGAVDLYVPKVHLGVAAGAYFVPLPAPGQAGAHDDLGAYFLSLMTGFDVG